MDPARKLARWNRVDPRSCASGTKVDRELQEAKDVVQKDVVAHAVAPAASSLRDDFVKVAMRGDVNAMGGAVMQPEIVIRYSRNHVHMKLGEEVDVLGRILQWLVRPEAGRKTNVVVKGIDMSLAERGWKDHIGGATEFFAEL